MIVLRQTVIKNHTELTRLLRHCTRNVKLILLLIERGVDLNRKSFSDDALPLILAAGYNSLGIADLLVSNGAEINADHCSGHARGNDRYVLQKGADGLYDYRTIEAEGWSRHLQDSALKMFRSPWRMWRWCEIVQWHGCTLRDAYSYYCVLKMSVSIEKLSRLAGNWRICGKFWRKFVVSVLREIFSEKVVTVRGNSVIFRSLWKTVFGDFLPNIIIKKLEENLSVKDLPLK